MKTKPWILLLLVAVSLSCLSCASLTSRQLAYVTHLTNGTPAEVVLEKLGEPMNWAIPEGMSRLYAIDALVNLKMIHSLVAEDCPEAPAGNYNFQAVLNRGKELNLGG